MTSAESKVRQNIRWPVQYDIRELTAKTGTKILYRMVATLLNSDRRNRDGHPAHTSRDDRNYICNR